MLKMVPRWFLLCPFSFGFWFHFLLDFGGVKLVALIGRCGFLFWARGTCGGGVFTSQFPFIARL